LRTGALLLQRHATACSPYGFLKKAHPMPALRTPDDRFSALPDWPFEPRYLTNLPGFQDLRMHYVDEGPRDADAVFLCLHGQPTWSYLYRKMIPVLTGAGGRVVAPDLFGFGRSDKPEDDAAYTYGFHRRSLWRFVEALDLHRLTLVCQDWGGVLGLSLLPEIPERFERLLVMNTFLPVGEHPGEGFLAWRSYNRSRPDLAVGSLLARSEPALSPAEAAAYDAPFPDARYKAGVRRFPELVPVSPDMEGVAEGLRARQFLQQHWQGRSFMAIGMRDAVIPPAAMHHLRRMIRGCPDPLELAQAGHFVQEHGDAVARAALAAYGEKAAPGGT
jgi:haloalkane dehalogenase